jgi:hypothetical protein
MITDPIAFGGQPLADGGLTSTPSISIGSIEIIDAQFDRTIEEDKRLVFGLTLPEEFRSATDSPKVSTSNAENGQVQAGLPQLPKFQRVSSPIQATTLDR